MYFSFILEFYWLLVYHAIMYLSISSVSCYNISIDIKKCIFVVPRVIKKHWILSLDNRYIVHLYKFFIHILQNTGIHVLDLNYYKETDLHESHVLFDLLMTFWKYKIDLLRSCTVFSLSFQTKMQTLNKIVWPEIAKLATEEVRKFGAGKN